MRPLRSFLLLLLILASLTGFSYVFPDSRLFPSLRDFLPSELINYDLLDKVTVNEQIHDTLYGKKTDSVFYPDTVDFSYSAKPFNLFGAFLDSLRNPEGQLRILFYGDSQIEGDRITFYLRKLLREGRGGTGPGLFLPVIPVMYTKSVSLRSSPNWKRYNYLSYRNGEITHNRLGPFMTICRYLPEGEISPVPEKAYVRIQPSGFADTAVAYYDMLRIFYANQPGMVIIKVTADENRVLESTLDSSSGLHEIYCSLKGADDILIEFEGRTSPDIYGISIESTSGIIVDNIPRRGSAGLEFTLVDRDNLEEIYRVLSPDLIILHYGLNIVRNVRTDYSYYKKGVIRQIALLNEVAPSTPVMIIGVTDMALNERDSISSYSNIPAIIEAQRRAAEEAGAVFWDSYKAMGGEASIVEWAEKRPPLAQHDYVHLTYPGADTLSQMLVEAMFSLREDTLISSQVPSGTDTIATVAQPVAGSPNIETRGKKPAGLILSRIFSYDPGKPFIFTTSAFWIFYLLVLAGYTIIYRKHFLRNFYLLLASLFFYYKSGGLFLFLLVLVTVVDFICGLLIHRSRRKSFKRLFIVLSLVSNLGILAYFKYTGFFISTINELLGTDFQVYDFLASFSNAHMGTSFNISTIILPVGISFFTFQSLSYTLDIYRGKLEPLRNIVDFGFYVSFFPQLVAGPIVRAYEFIPQLYRDYNLTTREFGHALFLILKGLIKKIIISDFIAVNLVDRVFDFPSVYSGFENLAAVYGYGLQIYCDFSGYTDIAIGLALILGFRLPVNFNSPYKATGIADFWKRWHISLSRWLKDYLYISLGGNRKGKIRTGINLMITMLLGGLWHGAALRFIIWGGLHGIGLVINKIWHSIFGSRLHSGRFGKAVAVFITFNFVSFCWIFFRAKDMDTGLLMLKQIAENFSPGSWLTVLPAYSSVFLLMCAGYFIHFLPERIKESYRGLFIRIPLPAQFVVVLLIAVLLIQMRTTEVMPFIYFRF
jgi:alginate O-acetyltransferase complex protein AlgI